MKKTDLIVIALFLLGLYFRVAMNGLNPDYPGNVNAMDPMHHTLNADWIVESEKYGFMPYYLAQGYENVIDYLPPYLYLSTAAFTLVSGFPAWDTMYLLTCLFSALAIPLLFIIGKKIFNESIGLLAAGLYVLPLNFTTWFYGLNVGMWILVAGFTMVLAGVWFLYEYIKKPRTWVAFALGLSVAGTLLIHLPETITLLPLVVILLLVKGIKMDKKVFLKDIAVMSLIPLIGLILFSPVIYFLLTSEHYHGMDKPLEIGFIDIAKTTNYPYAEIIDLSLPLVLVALIGFLFLFLNREKYWFWLVTSVYMLVWIFALPSFINKFDYVIRQRFMIPFFLLPVAGFGIYILSRYLKNYLKVGFKQLALVLVAIFIVVAYMQGFGKGGEVIDENRYQALLWMKENTDPKATIFFLDGFYQKSGLYSKRVSYQVYPEDFNIALQEFTKGNIVTRFPNGSNWISFWVRGPHRDTYFDYDFEFYEPRDKEADMTSFDYIVMQDFEGIVPYNQAVREMLKGRGYGIVYEKNGIYIMEASS